eukprot:XP_001694033.1 predicted protein [Chlamydomonas reinhardtii]
MSEDYEEKLMKGARGAKRHAATAGKTLAGASHHTSHGHKRGGRAGGLVLRPIAEGDGSFAVRIAHPSETRLQMVRPNGFGPAGDARARRQLHRSSAACRSTCKADVPVAELWPYL